MASEMQKYFMLSGTVNLISSANLKKWSTAFLLVKITAVCPTKFALVETLNSWAPIPSTWINGLKSILSLYLSPKSKYGDLSVSGLGCDTKIDFTFKLTKFEMVNFCSKQSGLSSKLQMARFRACKCTK